MRRFQMIIDVTVIDEDLVMEQAREKILTSGCPEAIDDLDLRRAVSWLFDSGSASDFGYSLKIDGSTTEEIVPARKFFNFAI